MATAELQKQQELFYNLINKIETEYHLYFGLKSIQKRLNHTESIYDHFVLNIHQPELCFKKESDLPEEIREIVLATYQQVFFEEKIA